MPKFVIEQDSSRKTINNEPLPLGQFIPGALSLKNTGQVYTLFVGDINNGSLVDDISIFKGNFKFYEQLLTLLPRLRNDVINPRLENIKNNIKKPLAPQINKTTGLPKPNIFKDINPEFIPHPNKDINKNIRKEIIKQIPVTIPSINPKVNLGTLLKPNIPSVDTKVLQNKLKEVISTNNTKTVSTPIARQIPSIKLPATPATPTVATTVNSTVQQKVFRTPDSNINNTLKPEIQNTNSVIPNRLINKKGKF
jgi:hypothetical protein